MIYRCFVEFSSATKCLNESLEERMTAIRHRHHAQEGPRLKTDHRNFIPYWKRAHRDWRFWVGVCFIFAAIAIYVTSVDLSLVPHRAARPPATAVDR